MADPIVGSQHEADNVLQVNQAEFEEAAGFRLDANYEPAWTEESGILRVINLNLPPQVRFKDSLWLGRVKSLSVIMLQIWTQECRQIVPISLLPLFPRVQDDREPDRPVRYGLKTIIQDR